MELTGTIIEVLPLQSGVSARSGNPWQSQEYVIEVPGQYPKRCVFKVFGEDKIRQFNILKGCSGTVSIDIDAREYNGRWYNDIKAYNFVHQAVGGSQPQPQPQPQPQQAAAALQQQNYPQGQQQAAAPFPPQQPQGDGSGNADDLPF